MADTTDKTSETTAGGSTATVKEPFYDIAKWATKAPEGEKLISTAYGDQGDRRPALREERARRAQARPDSGG